MWVARVHVEPWLLPGELWVFPGCVSGWEVMLGLSLWSQGWCCVPAPRGSVAARDRNGFQGRTWGSCWMNGRGDSTLGSFRDPQQDGMAVPFGELTACRGGEAPPPALSPISLCSRTGVQEGLSI